jgi:hypothetical protein
MDYDSYEALESEADAVASIPQAAPNQRRVAPQMNEQDVEYTDEVVEEEVEADPAPKPVRQRQPHNSNMSARARVPVPVINPNTGRPEKVKSTDEELEELEAEEEAAEAGSEANMMAQKEKLPKWVAYHQPDSIMIINTQTGEKIEGFKDEGTAAGIASLKNEVDFLIVSGGFQ